MFILWYLSSVTSPAIAGYHANIERGKQHQPFTARFIGSRTKSVGHYAPAFVLYAYQSQCCLALLPTKLHCSSSSHMRHVGMGDRG